MIRVIVGDTDGAGIGVDGDGGFVLGVRNAGVPGRIVDEDIET